MISKLLPFSALLLVGTASMTQVQSCEDPIVQANTPPPGVEDLNMTADDFQCLTTGTPVRKYFVWNQLGHLDEALEVANTEGGGGDFPVGTILQLAPFEAMVKRFDGFSDVTNDWEYFLLEVTEAGTIIEQRGSDPTIGTIGVENFIGQPCQDCHALPGPEWDFTCETGHGCEPLPGPDALIFHVQRSDPRCP